MLQWRASASIPTKPLPGAYLLIDERRCGHPRTPFGSFRGSEKMHQEDPLFEDALPDAAMPGADPRLVERLRAGDAEAGHRFVGDHYPAIYRYLLYLTGRPEAAEDLTQETFLQAWRRLDTFDEGAPLRPWLHRIAHREFLQSLRKQRPHSSLEDVVEISAP